MRASTLNRLNTVYVRRESLDGGGRILKKAAVMNQPGWR